MQEYGKADGRQACVMLRQFLEERYKGTRPCCGRCPARSRIYLLIYEGLFGLASGRPHLVAEPPSRSMPAPPIPPRSAAMKFDSIAIGGGMAGLSAALRLAEAGQKTC
jgi:hypothetical protein